MAGWHYESHCERELTENQILLCRDLRGDNKHAPYYLWRCAELAVHRTAVQSEILTRVQRNTLGCPLEFNNPTFDFFAVSVSCGPTGTPLLEAVGSTGAEKNAYEEQVVRQHMRDITKALCMLGRRGQPEGLQCAGDDPSGEWGQTVAAVQGRGESTWTGWVPASGKQRWCDGDVPSHGDGQHEASR